MSGSSGNGSAVGPNLPPRTSRSDARQNGTPWLGIRTAQFVDPVYLPGGKKSLSAISVRALGLGVVLGVAGMATIQLAYNGNALWRAPFFVATLALFHYLEFDSTARFNPPDAKISSFLLSANGSAYNVAHTAALTELFVRHWFYSESKPDWLDLPFNIPPLFPSVVPALSVGIGLILVVTGQYVRTAAMAQAGKNFNHIVQSTKQDDHILVTSGVYSLSRHPSYFGFFWWGLGTQLVLGNPICFPAYALVLWKFFASRINSRSSIYLVFRGEQLTMLRQKRNSFWLNSSDRIM